MLERFVAWCEGERESLQAARKAIQEGTIRVRRGPSDRDDITQEQIADIDRRLRELDQLLDAYRRAAKS